MISSRALSRLSTLALLAALAVLIGLAGLLLGEMARLQASLEEVAHTHEALTTSDHLLQYLTDAESSARGYVLTGDPSVLEEFEERALAIPPALDRLSNLSLTNPRQSERAAELREAVGEKLDHLSGVVGTRSTLGSNAARELVASGDGQRLRERVRLLVAEFDATEEAVLSERRTVGASRARSMRASGFALTLAAPLLLLVGYFLNRRALQQLDLAQRRTLVGEARLRVTLQSCGDALIATDAAGNVVLINPVAQALTGWREDQALGMPIDRVFHIVNEFTRNSVENPVSRALREGKVVGLANSTVLISKDGRELPIDDSGAPIVDDRGEAVGVILVFRDVTSRKISEQNRERLFRAEAERQAALDSSKAKDEFLALLSHELRSPLAAIRGWLDLLRGGLLSGPEVPGALQRIDRNARLQERLVKDLLDVSRIVTGKLDVVRSPVDLGEIVEAAVAECRAGAEQKGLTLTFERRDARLLVMGDEQRLVQCVTNVVGNAIQFTSPGGWVRVALDRRDAIARVVVSDTGIGMSEETRSRLFERFWQAEIGRKRGHGGLGLGLAIARYLIEEHGGKIEAASEGPGLGSTFTLEIPLLDPGAIETAAPADASPARADLAGLTILLVEEEPDARDATRLFLEALGARVRTATSASEAVRSYDADRPDLVLSDVKIADESGYPLVRHIRDREQGGEVQTPVVALIVNAGPTAQKDASERGFAAHVSKPVALEELTILIRKLTDKG